MINHSRLRQVTISDLQGLPSGYEGDRRVTDVLDQALKLGEKLLIYIRQELLPTRPAIYEELQRIMARHERQWPPLSKPFLPFTRWHMLWTILLVLFVMWALGLGFGVAGNLIHVLLVVALVVLIVNLLQGRRSVL
jgi:hypothetical protein